MNINDQDIDLTLALGSGNLGRRVSSSSGAGANANARLEMPFAASDPLSELVWSPLNGLSLKCANSSLIDKKPFLTWNLDESIKDTNSMSHSIRSKGSRGIKISDDKNVRTSPKYVSSSNLDAHQQNRDVNAPQILAHSLPNLQPRDEADNEATSASGDVHKNKTTAPTPIPSPTLMMVESSAENDLGREAPTDSRMCLYQEKGKGKEKVYMWARSSNDEDDSHGSMESCNSTGLLPKGVKRTNFALIGSKRTRKQMEETHDSTPLGKGDSSFMKWISNMVKGLSDSSKEDPSPVSLTVARSNNVDLNETTRPSMGFQTVFQSLYSTKEESRQLVVADGKNENSCKQIVVACSVNSSERTNASEIPECKRAKAEISPSRSSCEKVNSGSGLNFPLPMSYMPGKSSPFSSLWITRLYTNIDSRPNDVLSSDDCAGDAVRASEEMASVFGKRLDALRHMIRPLETGSSSSCQLICLFCGRNGHDLRKCPKLTATELEDLKVKISSFDKIEESPCLCIRCFQLDHWAISCPRENMRSEQLRFDDKCLSKRPSTSNLFQKSCSSSSEQNLKDKHVFPPRKIIDARNNVPEEEMFNAISKLRLSRANILRWMNSDVPLSHLNGFFLRLRVAKIEGGPEGTSYYVACITAGDAIESINSKLKKSVLVDVGGIKSSVGSQYISNHDFLEDEIKAWWSRIVKNGCKVPSIDELKSKCEHKKRLSL